MTAVRWVKGGPCTVVTPHGNLAGYVNSVSSNLPQEGVQVMIPSVCLMVVFADVADTGRLHRGSWYLAPADPGAVVEAVVRPDAAVWVERYHRDARYADGRSELVEHLHTHPDHAGRYRPGHDFVLRGTADIRDEHRRLHGDLPGRST